MNIIKFRYGLIGEKLVHSFSPSIHKKLGLYDYELIETSRENLENILLNVDYKGLNVTIPFKRDAMKFCDELSDEAKEIGSVNTIVKTGDGRLYGYNTDFDGFMYLSYYAGIDFKGKKVLILGNGGTSLTVQNAAKKLGASQIIVLSRSGSMTYEKISEYQDSEIIVNATPVGMYPNNLDSLISLDNFEKCIGVIDVIYNPRRTAIIMDAEKRKIPCIDGLPMLVYQAKRAEELFVGNKIPDSEARRVIDEIRAESGNIILIGMPGAGKSTVAEILASRTGKSLVSIDAEIEKKVGKTISEIFEQNGEPYFREIEREETAKAGKLTGAIIDTGGGIVKDIRNYELLHQNGRIYYLKREVEKLDMNGRPLSKSRDALIQIAQERGPLYCNFADASVFNNTKPEDTAEWILEDYYENISH